MQDIDRMDLIRDIVYNCSQLNGLSNLKQQITLHKTLSNLFKSDLNDKNHRLGFFKFC